jgi:hypothetical protein
VGRAEAVEEAHRAEIEAVQVRLRSSYTTSPVYVPLQHSPPLPPHAPNMVTIARWWAGALAQAAPLPSANPPPLTLLNRIPPFTRYYNFSSLWTSFLPPPYPRIEFDPYPPGRRSRFAARSGREPMDRPFTPLSPYFNERDPSHIPPTSPHPPPSRPSSPSSPYRFSFARPSKPRSGRRQSTAPSSRITR